MQKNQSPTSKNRIYSSLQLLFTAGILLACFAATLIAPITEWTSFVSFEESRAVLAIAFLLFAALMPGSTWIGFSLALFVCLGHWLWAENYPAITQYRNALAFTGAMLIPIVIARVIGFRISFETQKPATVTLRIWDIVLVTSASAGLLALSRQFADQSDASYTVIWPITVIPSAACVILTMLSEVSGVQRICLVLFWASLPLLTLGIPVWDSETLLAFVASDVIKVLGWCLAITHLLRLFGLRAYRLSASVSSRKEFASHVKPSPAPIA